MITSFENLDTTGESEHASARILMLGIVRPLQTRVHLTLDSANRWAK